MRNLNIKGNCLLYFWWLFNHQSTRNLDITGNFLFLFNVAVQLSVDAGF